MNELETYQSEEQADEMGGRKKRTTATLVSQSRSTDIMRTPQRRSLDSGARPRAPSRDGGRRTASVTPAVPRRRASAPPVARQSSLRGEVATEYRSPDAVPIVAWANAVQKGGAKALAKEFYDLKKLDVLKQQQQRTDEAFRRNKLRSRYEDVGCWDQTRVPLLNPTQDFIHANYVDGVNESRKYILTQGPLELTMGDKGEKEFEDTINEFWDMVWEQKCTVIVMLCLLEEDGKSKCSEYWPSQKKDRFVLGNFAVTCKETEEKSIEDQVIVVTQLELQKKGVKAKRELAHFHHKSWPDRLCPGALPIVEFLEKLTTVAADMRKKNEMRLSSPIVVHCSAGIGRSGTLVAIDVALSLLKTAGAVDVFYIVHRLRLSRRFAVQTLAQYSAIYVALLTFLLATKRLPSAAFNLTAFTTDVNAFLAASKA